MQRYVPRALLSAVAALALAACAPGEGPAAGPGEGGPGGRYRVLIPALEVQGVADAVGQQVANEVRGLVSRMDTHTAVPEREMRGAMREHDIAQLDPITARQLAPRINALGLMVGTIQPGGEGLQGEMRYIDVRSGDEIVLDNITGANPRALGQAIFERFQQSISGIRLAAFCNDFLASQQYERALENCEQAIAIVPTSTLAHYGRATALYNLAIGQQPGALQADTQTDTLDVPAEPGLEGVVEPAPAAPIDQARMQQALEGYEQVLAIDENHQDALLGAGLAAARLERGPQAQAYFNRYLELNPGDVAVRMRVAGDIAQTGDVVSAYEVLAPAAAENVENLDFQQYFAQVATAAGQRVQEQQDREAARRYYESALAGYNRVLAERGEELDASMMMQIMAVNQALERTDEALRIGQQATQRFPDNVQMWARYGDILRTSGRHAEAIRAYQQVIQQDPQYEGIHIRIALSQMEAGQRQQALASLERAAAGGDRQQVAQTIFAMASAPLRANQHAEAANLLSVAHQYATGQLRNQISFFWGFSLYRQGEAIARANTAGNVQQAQRAIDFFRRSIPLVEGSGHEQAGQVAGAARQFIENQEAIIRAGRGR